MKTFKKSSGYLLGVVIASSLSACGGSDDKKGPEDIPNTAPFMGQEQLDPPNGAYTQVPADAILNLHEKAGYTLFYLQNGVVDAEGDILYTQNLERTRGDDSKGFDVSDVRIGVRPLDYSQDLHSGETHTVAYSYTVSDGKDSIARSLTVNIIGEDFIPDFEGDLSAGYTKGDAQAVIPLLDDVTDGDAHDVLSAVNLVVDESNLIDMPASITSDYSFVADISAIKNDLPLGVITTFNYSYDIYDGHNTVTRQLKVDVFGVEDIPETPVIEDYFPEVSVSETAAITAFDLADGIYDREGDAIVIFDAQLKGSDALPYNMSAEENNLNVNPHAYFQNVEPEGTYSVEVTYKVKDDKDNVSDGFVTLTINVTGEKTNELDKYVVTEAVEEDEIPTVYAEPGFENPADLGGAPAVSGFIGAVHNWNCAVAEVTTDAARTGNAGLRMVGDQCRQQITNGLAIVQADKKYVLSHWYNMQVLHDGASHPGTYFPLITNVNDGLWTTGIRNPDQELGKWVADTRIVNTFSWGNFPDEVGKSMSPGIGQYLSGASSETYYDDLALVEYSFIDQVASDVLVDDVGTFDGDIADIVVTNGTIDIVDVAGDNKLQVTTASSGVTSVSLPISAGAVKQGSRYIVVVGSSDVTGSGSSVFTVNLSNGADVVEAHSDITAGVSEVNTDVLITEEYGRTADVDWSAETMVLNLNFAELDRQYNIDNVRLIEIP
ncbi:hypothetical protein [Agaribacterium sp. ZY112]|uniref:hypothetical protein n=1 Tax=Agaribacterium sp. ZY112 TaxID=3233574 RepID=UPI0035243BF5